MTARTSRSLSKKRPGVPPRQPRVMLRGLGDREPQTRVAINGEAAEIVVSERDADYVLVSGDAYERMMDEVDEREATAAYDRTRGEETVPAELVDRLLAGENAIRVWREHRGMTLDQLGAAIGKRKGYLSEIESGKKPGSLATLRAIAAALRVDLDDVSRG